MAEEEFDATQHAVNLGLLPAVELSPREFAALQAMLAQVLARLTKGHLDRKRDAAEPLFTQVGQTEVPTLDGVPLGTVKLKNGRSAWWVTSDWLPYCEANHPEHVVTRTVPAQKIREVSPSFTAEVIAQHKKRAVVIRKDTGELVKLGPTERLPGIAYNSAQPVLEIRPDWQAATPAVLAALGANVVYMLGLEPTPAAPELELEASEVQAEL